MRVGAQLLLTLLLNAAWQVALIAAFAVVCDWVLRGTAARYRHGLWVFALFLALALPLLSSAGPIKTFLTSRSKPQATEVNTSPIFVTRVSSPDLDSMESPAAGNPVVPAFEPARRNFLSSPLHLSGKLAEFLLALYGFFLLYRAGQFVRAWRRTKSIVQSAVAFESSGPIAAIIKRCQIAIGVHRVRILCSEAVPVPITVGILSPMIVIPERLLHDIDEEVLTTAIGHELVHVARRDYLTNLIYELIFLPLSFHPALALVRRRIKQTRELCCDEAVATKLLGAETYARSLVRLIGSAPIGRRMAADTTIGITESDILEVRIMSLLKTPKLPARRKRLLLITASLLLVVPCVAATSFALTCDIDRPQPVLTPSPTATFERENQERVREDLKRAVRDLQEQKRVTPESQRQEIEARLREVQQKLAEHERLLQQDNQQKREDEQKKVEELRTILAQLEKTRPPDEARLKDVREKIALIEKLSTENRELQKSTAEMQKAEGDRKARVIYRVEPEYPQDAREKKIEGTVGLSLTIDHEGLPQNIQIKRSVYPSLDQSAIEAARKMRFEPAMKNGQPVSMFISVDFVFAIEQRSKQELEAIQKRAAEERSSQDEPAALEMKMRKDLVEQRREERARREVELTRGAVLTMDRAIQIATSQVPGKVLACSLGRDGDKLFYHVVIINGESGKSTATYVYVSAIDGQILKTEKEERKEKEEAAVERAQISGGVLNSKADSLPQPEYPPIAKAAHASGPVTVEVTIDETGNVVAAHAVSGHPLLQAAAVRAARQATFKPTRLNGEPVKVAGVLVYTFAAQ